MLLRTSILFLLITFTALCSFGQEKGEYTQSRILILLDESSSMIQQWAGGREKIKVANELILKIMDSVYSVNPEVEFSLRVFGNQHTVPEHDCTDTKNEVPFSKYNKTQMEFRLEDLHPLGVTPIAYSLSEAAAKDLTDEKHNAYSIILITDGGESCGGDICDVMQKLINNKVYFRPYILNLEEDPQVKKEYSCMGDYLQVTKKGDIAKAVGTIVEAFRPMLKMTKADYTVLQNISVPSTLKVKQPTFKPSKKDTVKVVAPAPIPVDTVAIVPKKHSTTVTSEPEAPKKATALKMHRIKVSPELKLYTFAGPFKKLRELAIDEPEFKKLEPDLIPVKPTPARLTLIPVRGFKKLKTVRAEPFNPEPVLLDAPEIKPLVPEVIVVKSPPARLTPIAIRNLKKIKIARTAPAISGPETLSEPDFKPLQPDVVIVPPTPAKLTKIALRNLKKIKIPRADFAFPEPVALNAPDIKMLQPDVAPAPPPAVEKPAKLALKKLKPAQFKMHLLYGGSFFDADLKPIKLGPPPPMKPIATGTATTGTPAKPEAKKPAPKTGEYTVEHEDAQETTLEVYLTNGKGKFYTTTPQVIITDPANNKEVKKFYRFVDPAGNPDPITNLPAGKYELTIAGRDDLLAQVDLQPNKKNKVYIKVKNFSLYFYYFGDPNRPVKEFSALVIQRNVANGKETVQKCTDRLEYEPGNYHIMINTFPEDVRNIDLDAESAGGIGIDQPGYVKFTTEVNNKTITLWKQTGERYLSFHTLQMNDPNIEHYQIQPGKYQVQYSNGVTNLSSSNRVIPFEIKSNQVTEVNLVK